MDFFAIDHGSIVVIQPQTKMAEIWVDEFVEVPDWAWRSGNAFAVDHRPAQDIIRGIEDAGFDIEWGS